MTTSRVYNFSAGPAVLPLPVLERAARELVEFPGAGMSVMEMSHRSKAFEGILAQAQENIRQLLSIPKNYHILFLQGGASLQFSMLPMSFLRGSSKVAEYIVTGSWGKKAVKEAKREGDVKIAWDGSAEKFTRVPRNDELTLSGSAAYVHFTSNETIEGVEFAGEPTVGNVPLVCDASSDILSRPLDISKYAFLYAGAQKNIGPSGVTLVILRDDFLALAPKEMPALLDYRLMVENNSLYNTPPTYGVYMVQLVTEWLLKDVGGLEKMAARNREKAALLYDAIDQSGGFYRGHAATDSRSQMNVTWRMPSEDLEKKFLEEAKSRGLVELKGHRSVGGLRASLYNAMPIDGARALRECMLEFATQHG